MAMLKMQRVYVYALLKYCKDILEALQRRGVVEIENLSIEDSVFFKDDTSYIFAPFDYTPIKFKVKPKQQYF